MTDRRVHLDVAALYAALDRGRDVSGLTWRALADRLGLSPSTLSRMGDGLSPDTTGLLTMCRWLRLPVDAFASAAADEAAEPPALAAELAPILARRTDLTDRDRTYLLEVVAAHERWRGRSR